MPQKPKKKKTSTQQVLSSLAFSPTVPFPPCLDLLVPVWVQELPLRGTSIRFNPISEGPCGPCLTNRTVPAPGRGEPRTGTCTYLGDNLKKGPRVQHGEETQNDRSPGEGSGLLVHNLECGLECLWAGGTYTLCPASWWPQREVLLFSEQMRRLRAAGPSSHLHLCTGALGSLLTRMGSKMRPLHEPSWGA